MKNYNKYHLLIQEKIIYQIKPIRSTRRHTYPLFKVYHYKRLNVRFLRTRIGDKKEATSDHESIVTMITTEHLFSLGTTQGKKRKREELKRDESTPAIGRQKHPHRTCPFSPQRCQTNRNHNS